MTAREAVAQALERAPVVYATSPLSRVLPARRLCIFASARSGSELLLSLLRNHPAVWCDSEVFADPRARPETYVDGRAVAARLAGRRVYGFKVTFEQLRWNEHRLGPGRQYLQRVHDRGGVLVFLDRRAILQQALSHIHIELISKDLARKKGHFREEEKFEFEPYEVDPAEVVARLVWHDDYARWAHEAVDGLADVVLSYEDDLEPAARHQHTADLVFTALGLPSVPVKSPLVKATPGNARDRVKNWDEVVDVVARTRFAALLD